MMLAAGPRVHGELVLVSGCSALLALLHMCHLVVPPCPPVVGDLQLRLDLVKAYGLGVTHQYDLLRQGTQHRLGAEREHVGVVVAELAIGAARSTCAQ